MFNQNSINIYFTERMWLPLGPVCGVVSNHNLFNLWSSMVCCCHSFGYQPCQVTQHGDRDFSSWRKATVFRHQVMQWFTTFFVLSPTYRGSKFFKWTFSDLIAILKPPDWLQTIYNSVCLEPLWKPKLVLDLSLEIQTANF
jgi:hypothetical protein